MIQSVQKLPLYALANRDRPIGVSGSSTAASQSHATDRAAVACEQLPSNPTAKKASTYHGLRSEEEPRVSALAYPVFRIKGAVA